MKVHNFAGFMKSKKRIFESDVDYGANPEAEELDLEMEDDGLETEDDDLEMEDEEEEAIEVVEEEEDTTEID